MKLLSTADKPTVRVFLVALVGWTLVALLTAWQVYFALAARGEPPAYSRLFLLHLGRWYLWAAATPLLYWLSRRFPFDREHGLRSALFHLPMSLLVGFVSLVVQLLGNAWLEGVSLSSPRILQGFLAFVALSFHEEVLIYWLVLAAATAYHHYQRYGASRERYQDLLARAAAVEAQLESGRAEPPVGVPTAPPKQGNGHAERLVIRDAGRVSYLPSAEIDWIEAADYYAEVHSRGRLYLLRESLGSLEKRLDPERFVRVHRSTIVNLSRVREVRPYRRGDYEVVLLDGAAFRMSRGRRASLEAALKAAR